MSVIFHHYPPPAWQLTAAWPSLRMASKSLSPAFHMGWVSAARAGNVSGQRQAEDQGGLLGCLEDGKAGLPDSLQQDLRGYLELSLNMEHSVFSMVWLGREPLRICAHVSVVAEEVKYQNIVFGQAKCLELHANFHDRVLFQGPAGEQEITRPPASHRWGRLYSTRYLKIFVFL